MTPQFGHPAVIFGSESSFKTLVLFGGNTSGFLGDVMSETTLLFFGTCTRISMQMHDIPPQQDFSTSRNAKDKVSTLYKHLALFISIFSSCYFIFLSSPHLNSPMKSAPSLRDWHKHSAWTLVVECNVYQLLVIHMDTVVWIK